MSAKCNARSCLRYCIVLKIKNCPVSVHLYGSFSQVVNSYIFGINPKKKKSLKSSKSSSKIYFDRDSLRILELFYLNQYRKVRTFNSEIVPCIKDASASVALLPLALQLAYFEHMCVILGETTQQHCFLLEALAKQR